MSPESAAALFWYVRNALFFEQGLDGRDDVMLASYDAFLADPERHMRALAAFLDFPYRPELVEHMAPRSAPAPPLEIDPAIRRRTDELQERLDACMQDQVRRRLGEPLVSPR
jgi:hypothetical protein